MIRQERWVNTMGGSNKDYIITYNDTDFSVVSDYGRVGAAGRRTVRQVFKNSAEMLDCVEGKRSRRVSHGYWLSSAEIWDDSVAAFVPAGATVRAGLPRKKNYHINFSVDHTELV